MPWRIPEEEIERVKSQTDLVALVQSRGIELKKHGAKDLVGRCPFHNDQDHPNLIVSPAKGLFHCMSCGKAGNPIQFVQNHDGISFRHAYELLKNGGQAVFTPAGQTSGPLKVATIPRLPCPLDAEADDATLFGQVVAYYHQKLKETSTARAYLASRGLDSDELITRFQLGFADRTLGLRLPDKNRAEGQRLRTRLTQLGLGRESGHEHFNGCIVVPFHDEASHVVSLYGRRAQRGELKHLYPPGPHRGLFNRQGLASEEIILCEAVFDALTFCANGFGNATCLFGTEGWTEELWAALGAVKRVRIAYDADDAGERAARRDAERFRAHGIEVFRVKFPHGMDANEYACKVKPAEKSLALLLNSAQWLGQAGAGEACTPTPWAAWPSEPPKPGARVVDELSDPPLPSVDRESLKTGMGRAPEPFVPAPDPEILAPGGRAPAPSLVAAVSGSAGPAAKKENSVPAAASAAGAGPAGLQPRGEAWQRSDGRMHRGHARRHRPGQPTCARGAVRSRRSRHSRAHWPHRR